MKYHFEYKYSNRFGDPHHDWTCIGRYGAVHFHVSDLGEKWGREHGERFSGGLEFHYREPPEYMNEDVPSHEKCWLLGCPCWHDGTSLYASENLIPRWRVEPDNHDRMFDILAAEYVNQFTRPKVERETS